LSAKTGIKLIVYAIALSTGLLATHVFVPPTPGPLAAAATLGADLGLVILLGLLIALPVSLTGYIWATYVGKYQKYETTNMLHEEEQTKNLPGGLLSFAPILVPIILIALKSIAEYPAQPFGTGWIYSIMVFIGNPVMALLIGVFIAFILKQGHDHSHFDWTLMGLKEAGVIILITGAGGAFGNVLRAGGIGEVIGSGLSDLHIGILLPFILAALLKSAQGSSTVAIITTAAIISPLLEPLGLNTEVGKALTVLAIGAGSITVSHFNDSYFWVVAQFSNLDTSTALKGQTLGTLVQGLSGIVILYFIWLLV
jgi:GntP family gluconate:H+ symporter